MAITSGIFSKFERDELNRITAKSILEKLMNIRQKIDVEFTARRLIWELMQNAKDNASLCNEDGEKVDIVIEMNEDQFIFSHNKGYFTNGHIRGLIRKYSSSDKDRDTEHIGQIYKTTGRFGTGFMTTHLLSEKVQIKSFYKNDHQTFNQFSFWLDRSGKNESKIIEGINNAFDEAEASIKKSNAILLNISDFKTSFIYPLIGKKKSLADIAIEEVKKGIAYTLINVPEINTVTIDEELIGDTLYKIEVIDTILHHEQEFVIYNLLTNGKSSKHYYLVSGDKEVQIIIPIFYKAGIYHSLELESVVPRIHLDFPMIGTEDLHLPFIVNSSLFEPTEPRDGISLIEDEDNQISQMNCSIILRAVNLYNKFLSYVGQNKKWNDLYNLARIKPPKKHSWIDGDWFKNNVIEIIREKLLHVEIVDVVSGNRIAIWNQEDECQVYFPYAENDSIREKIWELSKKMYPQFVPIKKHIDQWNEIIWNDCYKFSISVLSEKIQDEGSLEKLANSLSGELKDAMNFLNDYYNLLNLEENHIKDVNADKFAVIPNQLGQFKKKTELSVEEKIDEELKNACSLISKDPREYLIHKTAYTGDGIRYYLKKQDDIINEINNILKENKNDNIPAACDYLASLIAKENIADKRTSIFEFSRKIYPNDFMEKRVLHYHDEKIWEESDKKSLFYIVSAIAEKKTIGEATKELEFEDEVSFLNWLDTLVSFLVKEGFENNINREKYPVLPNQNGIFCTKDKLFLDEGNIDEELKDISREFGHDFRKELLDTSIFLELPENRIYTIENVAEKISSFVKPILRDIDKRKQYKDTLKKFYLWMNSNKEKADMHFSDLFDKRFLFLEDDDISSNMKKATEFDQLMEEHGINSIEDLRKQLIKLRDKDSNDLENGEPERIDITSEILVSLGISSPKELEDALKDPAISSRFFHTSSPTVDMFMHAQRLIKRAKQNIIEFLRSNPDYDCTDLEEIAPTILTGIIKNGVPIHIVTRPSDNGEVIIYYSSEKDTLDSNNAELWVDNGNDDPHILTLGRILKSTGINRIPIIMS